VDDIQPRFHRYNEAPGGAGCRRGCGGVVCLYLLFGVTVAVGVALLPTAGPAWAAIFFSGLLLLSVLPWVLGRSFLRGSLCAGVRIDSRGLRVCYPLGFGRRYGWDEIEDVLVDDNGASVLTSGGQVPLSGELSDWMHLVGQCQRALGRTVTRELDRDAVVDLPPEEVARWLGVADDGALTCASPHHRHMPLYVALVVVLGVVHPALGALSLIGLGCAGYFGAARRRGRRISEVRATPTDLDVHTDTGWRKYPWGGLQRLARRGVFWVVSTVDGDLWLPPRLRNERTLLEAIRYAIEARRRGFALPRMSADVSEAALSRADAGVVDVERGLSRAEEGAEG
jgi:hypothetical protein